MLYFITSYIWSWIIVPASFIIVRPFVYLNYNTCAGHFLYTVLGIHHTISGSKLIDNGFILANHRGFFDCIIDGYMSSGICINRALTMLAGPFIVLLAYIENRSIIINRGSASRHEVYQRCIYHINRYNNKRVFFYPEGTRNSYTHLNSRDELKGYIKFGLLKSIYENKQYPVQLMITSNKEIAFNEKRLWAKYGVTMNTKISDAIHPKDFATETEFFDKIVNVWYDCYKFTHTK